MEGRAAAPEVTPADRLTYIRPSRYAESDQLVAVAHAEFAGLRGAAELLAGVSSWVGTHLRYVPGSSGPTDGAVHTLLRRQGVCRDYAHLVVALLRALDVPARLAAVYALGLEPMDFHAVAEALVDGRWCVMDATLLAPRAGLVRIHLLDEQQPFLLDVRLRAAAFDGHQPDHFLAPTAHALGRAVGHVPQGLDDLKDAPSGGRANPVLAVHHPRDGGGRHPRLARYVVKRGGRRATAPGQAFAVRGPSPKKA